MYERAMDDIRAGIRSGTVPDPTKSSGFQMLLDESVERIQAADILSEPIAEEYEQDSWQAFWEIVWQEAEEAGNQRNGGESGST